MSQTFIREVAVDVAEGDGRTLVARIVPYGEVTTVNDGQGPYQETILPGAFDAQERAANRIKAFLVNFRHQRGLQDQVGHATKIEDREDGLYGELRIFNGAVGDHALELVNAGVLNRLSIEFAAVKDRVANGVTQRVKARLIGVALVPEGTNAYTGAEVLAVREGDEPEDEPDEPAPEESAPAHRTVEPPPPLDAERLERLGIDTKLRAFTDKPWNGSAGRWPDAASYCAASMVDNNPSGAEKTKSECHFPYREDNGDVNVNALRAIVGGRGAQASFPGAQQARARARRMLDQFNKSSGGNG